MVVVVGAQLEIVARNRGNALGPWAVGSAFGKQPEASPHPIPKQLPAYLQAQ